MTVRILRRHGSSTDPGQDDAPSGGAAATLPPPAVPGSETDTETADGVGPGRTLRLLHHHMSPIRGTMVWGIICLVGGSLSGLLQPLATGRILATLDDRTGLQNAIVLLVAVLLGTLALNFLGSLLLLKATEGVVASARDRLVRRVLSLSVPALHRSNPGELATRLTSDSSMIRVVAMTCVAQLVTGLIAIVGSLVVMIALDPFLLTVTLSFLILPGSALLLTLPRVKLWASRTQRAMGLMGKDLERAFGMLTTVKANNAQPSELRILGERIEDVRAKSNKMSVWRAANTSVAAALVQVAYLGVLAVGGVQVQRGEMDVPELVTFLMYAAQLSAPAVGISMAISSFQTGQAALERIAEVELMEREADSVSLVTGSQAELVPNLVAQGAPGASNKDAVGDVTGRTAFTRAVFRYPGAEHPAMRAFSFTVPSTGLTALVGPSGSGKSTVLRVLCGFYALESGHCEIGGIRLPDWDVRDLRTHVAYVEQESPVLEGTIRSNLLYGHPDPGSVTDEQIHDVIAEVQLKERVPDLDAAVGYRGGTLSGGERQRLSVARGLLRRPKLLLLDECTSALDIATEQRLLDRLRERAVSTPMLMVAHRLESVRRADQIAVLAGGRLQGIGTHEELVRTCDLYRGMVQSDGDGPRDEGPPESEPALAGVQTEEPR